MSVRKRVQSFWWMSAGLFLSMAVGATLVAACRSATGPMPANAQRFAPPAAYARWWALTEACSGRSGALSDVRWYRAPGSAVTLEGHEAGGYWSARGNYIVLAEAYLERGDFVRHEMLHALMRTPDHPQEQFRGTCASVLRCQACGPWHLPRRDYAILPPDSLDVDAEAELLAREADGQRWLVLWVSVRNARAGPVVVAAPGDPMTPPTFGFKLFGPAGGILGGEVATDSSTLFFQPFETKRWLFEFRVASALTRVTVPPGEHEVGGGYARRWAANDTIVVSP